MNKHELFKQVIMQGCSLEIGKLTLCCIDHYYKHRHKKELGFQVHVDHHKFQFTEVYDDLDIAVDKFIALKHKIYGEVK